MCKHLRVFTVGVYRDTHFSIDKYYNIIFIIWIYFFHCFCVWKNKQTISILQKYAVLYMLTICV